MWAQGVKKGFEYYKLQLDSIVSVYSTDTYKRARTIQLNFQNAELNLKERKKIVDKIRGLFEQKKYINLYLVGHELLYIMWNSNQNPIEIRQMIMEIYLKYYFYTWNREIYYDYYNEREEIKSFTPRAKKRIIEILEGKKTKEEYEIFEKFYRILPLSYVNASWRDAARLMKDRPIRNDTILRQIRDSILNDYIIKDAKQDFEELQIRPSLIRMIGFLGMKECIPVLKQQLAYCIEKQCYKELSYRYALARLGDNEQRQYLWNVAIDIETFWAGDFAYFRDDGLIWHYIDVNYSSGKSVYIFSDSKRPANIMTMNDIYPYIKNLPKELEYSRTDISGDHKWAKSVYEWLMANRDKIEFDYEGEKKWPW
jgi:hypothetical protein